MKKLKSRPARAVFSGRLSPTQRSTANIFCCAAMVAAASLLLYFGVHPRGALAQGLAPAQSPAQGSAQALTVERIYSAPSLSGSLIRGADWSPDGKLLVFLERDAASGEQQIMAIDAATGRRRVLIETARLRDMLLPPASRGQQTGLGRFAIPRYQWSPDSRSLLFISADALFWYDLASGDSKRLVSLAEAGTEGEIDDAKIAPDGRLVSFLRNHDIWVVAAAGGAARQVTRGGVEDVRNGELDWVYPEELKLGTAYWWSPDSSRIAFLQLDERPVGRYPLVDELSPQGAETEERYPVAGSANPIARVGVAEVATAALTWMDTGADASVLLPRVAWLPDSRRVAIERENRLQNHLDLLFADAASGKSQTMLQESDPNWINLNDDLYFFADGRRFLWASERSGFRHLYLYDLAGKQLAQLTHGDWEVDELELVDEGGGAIYFTSTQKSAIERQLYRVSFSGDKVGGEPQALTYDPGTHHVDVAPDGAHFFDTFSTALRPPKQALYNADGSLVAAISENNVAGLERYRLQPAEFLKVPGADGTRLDAELIKPAGFDPARKYPVLVYVYGGPEVQNVRNEWQGSTLLWNELMSQKGFVIFSVDNRGAAGHGHGFETPIYRHFGQVELADQLAAVAWLSQQPYVDRAHMGIWGWSYGGYMACLAMLKGGNVFKAGFAGAPVTDWKLYDTIYTERYMGTPQENPAGYRESSPVNFAAGLRGKLLIAHATGDDNVHFANTVELAEKLVEAEKYAEIQIYAGRGHGISDPPARIHIFNRMTQFFLENLAK